MLKAKDILSGFLGGVVGGAVVDLIFINLAGPSALFTLLGITERVSVFWSHLLLGAISGTLFVLIVGLLPKVNLWLAGLTWGLVCLGIIGGIPSYFAGLISPKTTAFGFFVWILYGLILVIALKFFRK